MHDIVTIVVGQEAMGVYSYLTLQLKHPARGARLSQNQADPMKESMQIHCSGSVHTLCRQKRPMKGPLEKIQQCSVSL